VIASPRVIDHGGRHASGAHMYGASRYVIDTHAHWPVAQQNDNPARRADAIPADRDRRQISQVRARTRHAVGRATSFPPQTAPVRATGNLDVSQHR